MVLSKNKKCHWFCLLYDDKCTITKNVKLNDNQYLSHKK